MKMKNENQDLLDLKIEVIDDEDTKAYLEVAIFVDKPEFLQLIEKVREEYSIVEVVPPDKDFKDTLLLYDDQEEKAINLSKYKSLDKFKELLPKEYDNVMLFAQGAEGMLRAQAEAVLICFEFGRPFYMVPIVLQAVMCGVADPKLLQHTQAVVQDDEYSLYRFDEIKIPQVVIEVSPYSTEEDVKQALRDSKRIFARDQRFKYVNDIPGTRNVVKRHRFCYWEELSKTKHSKIADKWVNRHENEGNIGENEVIKAIKTYKQLLTI